MRENMLAVQFNPFPNLSTDRLLLRRITPADANALFVLRSDENMMRYIARPVAKSLDDVLQLIQIIDKGINQNEAINWALTIKEENKLIGTIGFVRTDFAHHRAEVGYMLHPDYQGLGIMQEALRAVIDFGFNTMKLHSIEAVIDPANVASAKLLERNHFIKEAHFKENHYFNGQFMDSIHYSLLTSFNNS